MTIFSLWNNGVCYGRFSKENWANHAADLFAHPGGLVDGLVGPVQFHLDQNQAPVGAEKLVHLPDKAVHGNAETGLLDDGPGTERQDHPAR